MAALTKAPSSAPASTDTTNAGNAPDTTTHEGSSNETTHGQADLASLLFGTGAPEDAGEGEDPDPEGGEKAPGEGAAAEGNDDDANGDDGDGDAGGTGAGEGEDDGTDAGGEIFCSFDGQDYTEAQVTAALKDHTTFNRFAESIKPLVADITAYGQTAESLKVAATTETDRYIEALTSELNSGRLNSQEHQQHYTQLLQMQERKRVLDHAVEQEQTQRKQAIQQVRTQNARKVGVDLMRKGWTLDQMTGVEEFSKQVFTAELFADALSPELMELLSDAMAHRKNQAATEAKLRAMGKKAVKTGQNKPSKPAAPGKEKDLGALLFGTGE